MVFITACFVFRHVLVLAILSEFSSTLDFILVLVFIILKIWIDDIPSFSRTFVAFALGVGSALTSSFVIDRTILVFAFRLVGSSRSYQVWSRFASNTISAFIIIVVIT